MSVSCLFFFFNDTATTEIYTLSLHDALPISGCGTLGVNGTAAGWLCDVEERGVSRCPRVDLIRRSSARSEEHTSELQSRQYLVCRLLLEKKKKDITRTY